MNRNDIVQLLPYVLSVHGVVFMWFAGKQRAWAWGLALLGQVGWFAWVVASKQWGFLPMNIAYTYVYARNWYDWHLASQPLRIQSSSHLNRTAAAA